MKITFADPARPAKGVAVVFVLEGGKWTETGALLDKKTKGALRRAAKAAKFTGKKGQELTVLAPTGTSLDRVLAVGLGNADGIDAKILNEAGGAIQAALAKHTASADIHVDEIKKSPLDTSKMAAEIAYGAELRSYRFDKYRTREKAENKPTLKGLTIRVPGAAAARKAHAPLGKIADGVFLTRDLVSEPPNVLYPAEFADRIKAE